MSIYIIIVVNYVVDNFAVLGIVALKKMLFTNLQLMTMMLVNLFCLPLLLILPILFFLLPLLSNDVVQDNVVVDNIFHYADDVVVVVMLVLLMSMIIVCILYCVSCLFVLKNEYELACSHSNSH